MCFKFKKNESFLKIGLFSTKIETYYEVQGYNGSSFKIEKSDCGANLLIRTKYFDEIDCRQELSIKINEIKKLLYLAFNLPIYSGKNQQIKLETCKNEFIEELNIIDEFLEKFDSTSIIYNKIIEAVSLFQSGLKIIYNNIKLKSAHISNITDSCIEFYIPVCHQELIDVYEKNNINIELSVVALISALEVVATINDTQSKICPNCNQQIYKLAHKVRCFSREFGDESIENNIKNAYSLRSQIVHAGILLERSEALQGVVNPRIDLSQNGGLLKIVHALPEPLLDDVCSLLLTFIKHISKDEFYV
jgi:hypothetical protein